MSQSFLVSSPLCRLESAVRRRVLVTGAAGRIGSCFAREFHQKYDLRLMVRERDEADLGEVGELGEVVVCDLLELARLKTLCQGVDTVLHLAGDASPALTWNSALENNIAGTYNLFVAAKAAGCRRVIYASSIHAVSGYSREIQVKTNEPVNPGDLYGVSKCFGEALGRYMAEQEELSVIALRIGAFQPAATVRRPKLGLIDGWISQRDLMQLIERCIDAEGLQWAVFHALSNNTFNRLDISDARALIGYEPKDNFTRENPLLQPLQLEDAVKSHSRADGTPSGLRNEIAESGD